MNASAPIEALRNGLRESRDALRASFLKGRSPARLLHAHARLIDRTLQGLWRTQAPGEGMALVAIGGYGRGELFPNSDVDVLILLGADPSPEEKERLERLVGMLWDIGLEIGHSVRQGASFMDGKKEVVGGVVMMLKGANSREVVKRVHDMIGWFPLDPARKEQQTLAFDEGTARMYDQVASSPG